MRQSKSAAKIGVKQNGQMDQKKYIFKTSQLRLNPWLQQLIDVEQTLPLATIS